jgi:hypothetical protein
MRKTPFLFLTLVLFFSCKKESTLSNTRANAPELTAKTQTTDGVVTPMDSGPCEGRKYPAIATNVPSTSLFNFQGGSSPAVSLPPNRSDALYWYRNVNGTPLYPSGTYDPNTGDLVYLTATALNGFDKYSLVVQQDGNLVLYKNRTDALWALNTEHKGLNLFFLDPPGAFGMRNSSGSAFTTKYFFTLLNSYGHAYCLTLQRDGNLVVYETAINATTDPNSIVDKLYIAWASDTDGGRVSCHFGN